MKARILTIILVSVGASFCLAQAIGNPEDSGLFPTTGTFYVNTNLYGAGALNGATESEGVAIAANGNVLMGWEDDGPDLFNFMGVWTLYDGNGNLLTPVTVQTNRSDYWVPIGSSVANAYLSYFRSDGTPTPAYTASMPKVKANLFGNGLGMAGTVEAWLGLEVAELLDINTEAGGGNGYFAALQLLNNDGSPVNILTGGTDANYEPAGAVRIADWDFLSNGNILIVNESRQPDDYPLTGQTGNSVITYRIVTPAGGEVKAWTAASSSSANASMWHGVGVTANGFALRFNAGGIQVRLFDNAGTPTTPNIDLTTLTGQSQGANRGDGAGFHGNGRDAYVNINTVNPGTGNTPWVTVLNADGTLRWSRKVGDGDDNPVSDRVDAAIAPDGRVLAVWDSGLTNIDGVTVTRLVQGRLFDPAGNPFGGKFVVSEWEHPSNPSVLYNSVIPRVAWRGDKVVVAWQSRNAPSLENTLVLAARFFSVPSPSGLSIGASGGNATINWSGGGTLEAAPTVSGPWSALVGASAPYLVPASGTQMYFRVRAW